MSKKIDEHVVGMEFENKKFESGVSDSLTTIDTLKKSLDFKGMSDGLNDVSTSADRMNFSKAARGVETLKNRFSVMGAVAFTIIQSITRKLMDVGRSLANTLVFEPVLSGFQEYETQINAIQTILANTAKAGTTLEDVSGALALLNTYADKTIYNFTEMTRNIGTFTAAGIALDTSVAAIKGIANLAAVSGSTSQQASTAMYQLSQALSTGTMKLQDWNSVVNAGMGGQVFKDALMETARLHGVAIDQMVEDEGSFRSTLAGGWLSSEILTDTLQKFTGDLDEATLMHQGYTEEQAKEIVKLGVMANDAATKVKTLTQLGETLKEAAQSGWTRSWELIIGDFEEAKKFLTEVSDTLGALIGVSADARNEILERWNEFGGRVKLIDTIRDAFNNLLAIMAPIKEAFRAIFPPITTVALLQLTWDLNELVNKFKIGADGAKKIKTIFSGFFAVLDIGRMAIVAIAKGIFKLSKNFSGFGGNITDALVSAAKYITNLRDIIKVNGFFGDSLTKLKAKLEPFYKGFMKFVDDVKAKIAELGGIDFTPIKEFFSNLTFDLEPIKTFFKELGESFSGFGETTQTTEFDVEPIKTFFENLFKSIGDFDPKYIYEAIVGIFAGGILLSIRRILGQVADVAEHMAEGVEGVVDILDGVGGSLQAWQNNLNAKALLSIAIAVGVLAAALFVIGSIEPDRLTAALGGLSVILIDIVATMKLMSGAGGGIGMAGLTLGLVGISVALLIMASALKKLTLLDPEKLTGAMLAVTAFLAGMIVTVKALSTTDGKMVGSAISIGILALALERMYLAVVKFGTLDIGILQQGLLAVGAMLLQIGIYTRIMGSPERMIATSVGIAILSGALLLLSKVIFGLGSMNYEVLNNGLMGLGVALTIVVAAMNLLPKNIAIKAVGLLVVSAALMVLAEVLRLLGEMELENIETAMIALGGTLLILAAALQLMSGSLAGAGALLVASGALMMLATALTVLGKLTLNEIGIALLAIAGVLVIFGLAGLILGPMVPILLALSAGLALFGAAAALVGVGVLALSAGLALLAVTGGAAISVLVLALTAVIGLIPYLVEQLGIALIALIQAIADAAPQLVDAVVKILKSLIEAFVEIIPLLVTAILDLITTLLQAIADKLPDIIQAGFDILLALLQGIADNIAEVVTTVGEIVVAYLDAMAEQLPAIIEAGFEFIIAFLEGMTASIEENMPTLITAFYDMGIALVGGLIEGLGASIGNALIKVKEIAQKIIKQFLLEWKIESPSQETWDMAKYLMLGVSGGIKKYGETAIDSASNMGKDLSGALYDATDTINDILEEDLDAAPTITPVLDLTDFSDGTDAMGKAIGALDTTVAAATAATIGNNERLKGVNDIDGEGEPSINFTQYNNSPKALSRLEIYRQTKLLLEAA